MPWRSVGVVDQRTKFVLRSLDSNVVFSELCEEFGISRKTGYKWRKRFVDEGASGLEDQSRSPQQQSRQVSEKVVCEIVKLKLRHRSWGPGPGCRCRRGGK